MPNWTKKIEMPSSAILDKEIFSKYGKLVKGPFGLQDLGFPQGITFSLPLLLNNIPMDIRFTYLFAGFLLKRDAYV